MKTIAVKPRRPGKPVELGPHLVADPRICHGQVTIKGTRVMAWQILDAVEDGEPMASIAANYHGVTEAAVAECVRLARESFLAPDGRLLNGSNGHHQG